VAAKRPGGEPLRRHQPPSPRLWLRPRRPLSRSGWRERVGRRCSQSLSSGGDARLGGGGVRSRVASGWDHPPLSASPTSPPQGGRSGAGPGHTSSSPRPAFQPSGHCQRAPAQKAGKTGGRSDAHLGNTCDLAAARRCLLPRAPPRGRSPGLVGRDVAARGSPRRLPALGSRAGPRNQGAKTQLPGPGRGSSPCSSTTVAPLSGTVSCHARPVRDPRSRAGDGAKDKGG